MKDIKEALKSVLAFSSLSDSALDELASFSSLRSVRTGETIFCQNEPSPYCFGIVSGEVAVQRVSTDRRFPTKLLGVISAGGVFGESALFEESPRAAMASASKDGELVVIRGSDFRQWITKRPEVSQSILLTLLKGTAGRLHRTSLELSVVYGIGRLLGSAKPFQDQLSATFEFLKSSLDGLDDLVLYRRSAYWEEFEPVMSLPMRPDLPNVPLTNDLIQKVSTAGSLYAFAPQQHAAAIDVFQLDWTHRAAAVIIPVLDWEKASQPLQGLLVFASTKNAQAFAVERQLLLSALAQPLAEAIGRQGRQQDAEAQSRLHQARQTYKGL